MARETSVRSLDGETGELAGACGGYARLPAHSHVHVGVYVICVCATRAYSTGVSTIPCIPSQSIRLEHASYDMQHSFVTSTNLQPGRCLEGKEECLCKH